MKKVFNLSVILAVLMAAFSFTSCSDDDDAATVDITLDSNALEAGAAATGKITADAEIASVTLFTVNGTSESSLATESKKLTDAAKGETSYDFRIESLDNGTYKLTVTDKDGNIASKTFIVGAFTLKIGGGSSAEGSYISIKNQAVYKSAEANENAAAIEIVFDGTKFKSAKESSNTAFKAEASATVTMNGNGCTFETSTGFKGTIAADKALGDPAATYTVTITKSAK